MRDRVYVSEKETACVCVRRRKSEPQSEHERTCDSTWCRVETRECESESKQGKGERVECKQNSGQANDCGRILSWVDVLRAYTRIHAHTYTRKHTHTNTHTHKHTHTYTHTHTQHTHTHTLTHPHTHTHTRAGMSRLNVSFTYRSLFINIRLFSPTYRIPCHTSALSRAPQQSHRHESFIHCFQIQFSFQEGSVSLLIHI